MQARQRPLFRVPQPLRDSVTANGGFEVEGNRQGSLPVGWRRQRFGHRHGKEGAEDVGAIQAAR